MRPGPSLAGVRLAIPDHAMGLPVLRALSLCTCRRQYPGAATGRRPRSSRPAVSAFPEIAVGSACTSSFSRLARRSLALRPAHSRRHLYVTRYTEGFSHFVTSMTASVASGWSVRRVGLTPTGKRRLLTAHANSGHSLTASRTGQVAAEAVSRAEIKIFCTPAVRPVRLAAPRRAIDPSRTLGMSACRSLSTASVAGDLPLISRQKTAPREAARTRRACGIRTP